MVSRPTDSRLVVSRPTDLRRADLAARPTSDPPVSPDLRHAGCRPFAEIGAETIVANSVVSPQSAAEANHPAAAGRLGVEAEPAAEANQMAVERSAAEADHPAAARRLRVEAWLAASVAATMREEEGTVMRPIGRFSRLDVQGHVAPASAQPQQQCLLCFWRLGKVLSQRLPLCFCTARLVLQSPCNLSSNARELGVRPNTIA